MCHIFKEGVGGTIQVFWEVLSWSLAILYYAPEHAKAGQPLAGGFFACLVSLAGDQDYMAKFLQQPHWASATRPCGFCEASAKGPLSYLDFRKEAPSFCSGRGFVNCVFTRYLQWGWRGDCRLLHGFCGGHAGAPFSVFGEFFNSCRWAFFLVVELQQTFTFLVCLTDSGPMGRPWTKMSIGRRVVIGRQAVWDPFNALRIGEAKNPGPGCADGNLRICVTNVGSILNKMDHVFNLPALLLILLELSRESAGRLE